MSRLLLSEDTIEAAAINSPGEPMRYTVRFDDLALPDPRAEEWDWQMNAAFRDADTSLFFDIVRSGYEEQIAKYISCGCPVTERCRQYALDAHEPHGMGRYRGPEPSRLQAGSATRFAAVAPVNPTTNPFESAMMLAVSIGGMP